MEIHNFSLTAAIGNAWKKDDNSLQIRQFRLWRKALAHSLTRHAIRITLNHPRHIIARRWAARASVRDTALRH
jgi:hypothetical protein